MRIKQIIGYFILAAATGFGISKIGQSGLLDHLENEWYSFLGFTVIFGLLGLAIYRVLRD